MRTFLTMSANFFAIILELFIAVGITQSMATAQTSSVLTYFFSVIGVLFFLHYKFLSPYLRNMGRKSISEWLSRVSDFKYKDGWDGTGIAIDPVLEKISLLGVSRGKSIAKTYPLSDVKEWGYEMPGYSMSGTSSNLIYTDSPVANIANTASQVSQNFGSAMSNASNAMHAREQAHFWVKVKDIDCPVWEVKFTVHISEKELIQKFQKWMEIMDQCVNRNIPA